MKNTEHREQEKFSRHLLEYQTRPKELPKELIELQDYLKKLSVYVEKYNKIKDGLARQNEGVPSVSENEGKWRKRKDFPHREMGFSMKEEIGEPSPLQIIEMTPAEEVTVITGNVKRVKRECEHEKELSSVIPNPVGKTGLELASDDSQIGIYFIEHVNPVNFVNILQRELSTLGSIFPDVNDIIKQITHEFDHFKVCPKCLDKVSPLLPDILKELQELIKFVKKKRNEEYVWPDDSEYLRKTSEESPKSFEKQFKQCEEKKMRQETVGFLTIHTNTPQFIKECESNIQGGPLVSEQSKHIKRCSMVTKKRQQLTVLQSKIQSDLTYVEKAETAEAEISAQKKRNCFNESSILTEFSTSQMLITLHPVPVAQSVLQYKVRGNIEYLVKEVDPEEEDQSKKSLALAGSDPNKTGYEKSQAPEVREILLTAKTRLRTACLEIQMERQSTSEMGNDLITGVKVLESSMLEVHENQIELTKTLLEKEVLNPALVRLTDPRVLRDEKEGMRKVRASLSEANADNPRREDLQLLLDELKSRCEMKNRLITSLLKGLQSNLACAEWEELITGVIQDSNSVVQSRTQRKDDFFKKSSSTYAKSENVLTYQSWDACTESQSTVEEILSKREIARATYKPSIMAGGKSARISFSEIIPKKSQCSSATDRMTRKDSLSKPKSFTMKRLNMETEKLFEDLEYEVNFLTSEYKKIFCEIEGLKRQKSLTNQTENNKTVGPGSRAINLTIKIGDQDLTSGYHSALSIVPSGASLKKKKPELSFPVNISEVSQAPRMKYSVQEFKSALNLSKEGISKRRHSVWKSTKSFTNLALKLKLPVFLNHEETLCEPKGIFKDVTDQKLGNWMPVPLDLDTTRARAWKSKRSVSYSNQHLHRNHSSDNKIINSPVNNDLLVSQFSKKYIHYKQNQTINNLRSRLRFLEKDLRSLRMTIDRMDILTQKLVDDAYESSENFKYFYSVFRLVTSRSNI